MRMEEGVPAVPAENARTLAGGGCIRAVGHELLDHRIPPDGDLRVGQHPVGHRLARPERTLQPRRTQRASVFGGDGNRTAGPSALRIPHACPPLARLIIRGFRAAAAATGISLGRQRQQNKMEGQGPRHLAVTRTN